MITMTQDASLSQSAGCQCLTCIASFRLNFADVGLKIAPLLLINHLISKLHNDNKCSLFFLTKAIYLLFVAISERKNLNQPGVATHSCAHLQSLGLIHLRGVFQSNLSPVPFSKRKIRKWPNSDMTYSQVMAMGGCQCLRINNYIRNTKNFFESETQKMPNKCLSNSPLPLLPPPRHSQG